MVLRHAKALCLIASLAGCLGDIAGDTPPQPDMPPQLGQAQDSDSPTSFPTDTSSSGLGNLGRASVVVPSTPLISSARVSASSVCPGASVRVDVTTARAAEVTIDRLPSRSRFMQIMGEPGAVNTIHVVALEPRANNRPNVESTTLSVTIRDCGTAVLAQPELAITQGWSATSPVKFTVKNSEVLGATSYVWDFGDGTNATTTVPAVDHLYALAKLGYYSQFDTSVTAKMPGGSTSTWKSLLITMPQIFALKNKGRHPALLLGGVHQWRQAVDGRL